MASRQQLGASQPILECKNNPASMRLSFCDAFQGVCLYRADFSLSSVRRLLPYSSSPSLRHPTCPASSRSAHLISSGPSLVPWRLGFSGRSCTRRLLQVPKSVCNSPIFSCSSSRYIRMYILLASTLAKELMPYAMTMPVKRMFCQRRLPHVQLPSHLRALCSQIPPLPIRLLSVARRKYL